MAKIIANHKITIYGTNTRQTLNMGVADFFVLNSIEAYKAGVLLDTPDLSFYMTKAGITQVEGRFTLGNEVKLPEGDTVDLITMWVEGVADPDITYLVGISYGTGSFNDLTTISYNKDLSLIAQAAQKTALNQNTGLDWTLLKGERVIIDGNQTTQEVLYVPNNKKFKKLKVFATWDVNNAQDGNHADIFVYIGNVYAHNIYNEMQGVIGLSQSTEGAVIVGDNRIELVLDDTNYPKNFGLGDYYLMQIVVANYTAIISHNISYQVFAIIDDA